jgi:hypothetical protein
VEHFVDVDETNMGRSSDVDTVLSSDVDTAAGVP